MGLDEEDLEICLRVLQAVAEDRATLADLDAERRRALVEAAGRVSRPARHERKRLLKALRRRDRVRRREHDARLVAETLNRQSRRSSDAVLVASTARQTAEVVTSEPAPELATPRNCYVCKADYRRLHPFYDSLCPPCADQSYEKRFQTVPLDGRVALVTGARIKIGYQVALKLLRAGCTVVATTRFPVDAAGRYQREPDFDAFRERLVIHGLDLVHPLAVERFAAHLSSAFGRLDFLVNNAAQTVRRPVAYYRDLLLAEGPGGREALSAPARALLAGGPTGGGGESPLPAPAGRAALAAPADPAFPPGLLDLDGQQIDLRATNSWRLTAADVPAGELLEVHLVNAVAPFLLAARLRPLMARTPGRDQHVVNVSAMEAQFARRKKTDRHPHTNMAKASLNMFTRTSAVDWVRDGIHMNSVDTGWVTDEDPLRHVARKQAVHDFHPPLDAIDGAARVLDPIFTGLRTGEHPWGLFFKDYRPAEW